MNLYEVSPNSCARILEGHGNRGYLDVLAPCSCVAGGALYDRQNRTNAVNAWRWFMVIALGFVGANFVLWLGYLLRRYPADGLHTYAEAWLWWLK